MGVMGRIRDSVGKLRESATNLFFAPFIALAALFGMLLIAVGDTLLAISALLGTSGNIGSAVREFGIDQLPDFYF